MENLHPASVWSHFSTLCAIPRPSRHEAALRDHLIAWAHNLGIQSIVDPVGNLILRKTASPGCESFPGVILQAHLDMVCQANADTVHDFQIDPIRTLVRDGWLLAEATTLGADNGIGVALALAALEEPELTHPALEVLLTVNEESGMDGARGLLPGTLRGKTLINLDTEAWGHFYLGCAGGVDVEVRASLAQHDLPPNWTTWRLDIAGLQGGHSGIDIHLGRGNAIKLLAESLRHLARRCSLQLIELQGGTARNAIPREAMAVFAVPANETAELENGVRQQFEHWCQRFGEIDPALSLICKPIATSTVSALSPTEQERLIAFLDLTPNDVVRMSDDFPGVVETSTNLGVAELRNGKFSATFKVRSLNDGQADRLADVLAELATEQGLLAWKDGAYPGWTPNPASPLLALCQVVYVEAFGQPANLQVIHAGLECGLLAASHPHLEMISFGPDIRGAHAPGEAVEIASVARCWHLLTALLRALASPEDAIRRYPTSKQ